MVGLCIVTGSRMRYNNERMSINRGKVRKTVKNEINSERMKTIAIEIMGCRPESRRRLLYILSPSTKL